MFGDMLQMMTAGKQIEYHGEQWILISNTMMQTTDKEALFVAIRATDTFPAQTYVIPAAPYVHLRSNDQNQGDSGGFIAGGSPGLPG